MKSIHQKVYLIRHGETEWSRDKKHTGLTDLDLTPEGNQQAEWLIKRLEGLSFKKVFVSPLQRALKTCKIAGFKEGSEVMKELLEWDYGKYEGMTSSEIHKIDPDWSIFTKGAPEGESIGDVGQRVHRAISQIRSVSGDVALFSSGHLLRSLTMRWLGFPIQSGGHFSLSTASVSILGYEHGIPALLQWNETRA
jgi:probable phosphoglycerate mutase